jgi:hypothetical protein
VPAQTAQEYRRRESALGYVYIVVPFFSCNNGDIFNSYVWTKDVIVRLGEYPSSDAVDLEPQDACADRRAARPAG